jgi:hypothetical protein
MKGWDAKKQPLVSVSDPRYAGFEVSDPEVAAATKRAEEAMWKSLRSHAKLCRPGPPHRLEIE